MHQPAVLEGQPAGPGRSVAAGEADEATRGSAIKLAAELAGRALALATTLLAARGLGVADFGVFAALSGIAVIVAEFSDLGLHGTASRALVARSLSLSVMVRTKLLLTGLLGLLTLAFVAWAPALARLLPAAVGTDRLLLLAPLLLYFTLAGWSEFLGVALRARGRRGQEAATILCLRASALGAVATAFALGGGLRALAWGLGLSMALPVAQGSLLAFRAYRGEVGVDPGLRAVLGTSFPLAVNGFLALISLRVELLLLAALRGPREVGLFAAAFRVIEFLNMVPAAINAGAMPALTREGIRGEGPVRQRTAGTLALLAAPAAAGLALVAPGLLSLLFGSDYASGSEPLRILAASVLALFMNSVLLHSLIAVGRAQWLPRMTALRVAAAVGLALFLIPRLGATGAAVGFLVAELVLLLLASRACAAARFQVPVARPLGLALCASFPMSAAVALSGAGPLVAAGVGLVTYFATLAVAWLLAPRLLQGFWAGVRYS